jgi:hypothetical protein
MVMGGDHTMTIWFGEGSKIAEIGFTSMCDVLPEKALCVFVRIPTRQLKVIRQNREFAE